MSSDTDEDESPQSPELDFGQTPFDNLSREELIRHCQRLYAATESLTSAMAVQKCSDELSPFWTTGTGGRALEQGEQALAAAQQGYDPSVIYRAFFRYARDLLFQDKPPIRIGHGWDVCPECGAMVSTMTDGVRDTGKRCEEVWGAPPISEPMGGGRSGCQGMLRPLEWADLTPVTEDVGH